MTEETKTDAKPATAESAERPSAIPPDEMARLTDEIVGALKTVYDPEIPADIYELGLIYKVDIDDDRMVNIDMTLTTPNCPRSQGQYRVGSAVGPEPHVGRGSHGTQYVVSCGRSWHALHKMARIVELMVQLTSAGSKARRM
jgi:hypothetical protein